MTRRAYLDHTLRLRRVIERARELVKLADEFPPEEVGPGGTWAGCEALERLISAIDGTEEA